MEADGSPPKGSGDEGAGLPALVAAAAALVSGIGALTLTGALGRVQRNEGGGFTFAIALVVLGAAIWVAGARIRPHARGFHVFGRQFGARDLAQTAGVVLSLVGVVVGFAVAIATASDSEQPDVSLALGPDGRTVSGVATVSNLSSQDRLAVFVDGLVRTPGSYAATNLYRAFVGPNGDGKATNKINVAIPPGRFDAVGVRTFTKVSQSCGEYERGKGVPGTGCVIIRLPDHPAAPLLTATWERTTGSNAVLKLGVDAADAPAGPDGRLVAVSVAGRRDRKTTLIYRATFAAPSTGAVKRQLRVPIPGDVRLVCARAVAVGGRAQMALPRCPRSGRVAPATVALRMPGPD